jgi:predicted adenine nucleotide alpha hydrolase (AANH) superfamily ATPase
LKLFFFLFLVAIAAAAAQSKKTVTMAVFGDEPAKFKALKPLKANLEKTLLKEGGYRISDRSDAVLKFLRKDFEYNAGTSVMDEDARQINELYKTQYICIVESSDIGGGSFSLEAKLVSAETGEPSATAYIQSKLLTPQDVTRAGDALVSQLLGKTGGIFINPDYKMNKLSQDFASLLKKKISIKDGYCGADGIMVQISAEAPNCTKARNSVSCSIEVSLNGHGCTNEAEVHLNGAVSATDRAEKLAIDMAKKELLSGKADFIKEWVLELAPWKNK